MGGDIGSPRVGGECCPDEGQRHCLIDEKEVEDCLEAIIVLGEECDLHYGAYHHEYHDVKDVHGDEETIVDDPVSVCVKSHHLHHHTEFVLFFVDQRHHNPREGKHEAHDEEEWTDIIREVEIQSRHHLLGLGLGLG